MYSSPSVYAHTLSGGLLLAAVIYLALYFSKVSSREPYQILLLLLLFSIATGIHGISHVGLESLYHYNPLSLFIGK